MENLEFAAIAKHLRRTLMGAFHLVGFTVTHPRGTTVLRVAWTDGPTQAEVHEITQTMRGRHHIGWTVQPPQQVSVPTRHGRQVGLSPVAGFVLDRTFSDPVMDAATATWARIQKEDPRTMATHFYAHPAFVIDGHHVPRGRFVDQACALAELRVAATR